MSDQKKNEIAIWVNSLYYASRSSLTGVNQLGQLEPSVRTPQPASFYYLVSSLPACILTHQCSIRNQT